MPPVKPQTPRSPFVRRDSDNGERQQTARYNDNRYSDGRSRNLCEQVVNPPSAGRSTNTLRPQLKKIVRELPRVEITNDLQITDGKHHGVQLKSTTSPKVRLTGRKLRETLFQVLNRRVRFARFLDLCAGSGAVGVEAISRGAALCTFVERSAKMCSFIESNLHACKVCPTGHGEIKQIEAVPFLLKMMRRKRCWDVIYFSPPYEADYDEVLQFFARGKMLREAGGVLVIEHHAEMFFPAALGVLVRRKVVREADAALTFYERVK